MTTDWNEPFARFAEVFELAKQSQPKDPNAATLASVDAKGRPSARVVLMKEFDSRGFVVYTNYESQKGRELIGQKVAALNFYWPSLDRQVRIEGTVEQVTAAESDEYFASRPRVSQLGAWASTQSQPLDDRKTLEQRVVDFGAKFEGQRVPRPPHWGGFRILPERIEFWTGRESRLHDRLVYEKRGSGWVKGALFP
ncbi:MAG: Pyridoxamine 5-phosphate oxidase [Myxococcaceae bacterium]|nr:Pyridoxamine 5-phosphate oxidase [Myxococcaceae bacterium]